MTNPMFMYFMVDLISFGLTAHGNFVLLMDNYYEILS